MDEEDEKIINSSETISDCESISSNDSTDVNEQNNFLYFYIQSKSSSSRLVGDHINTKKGPFLINNNLCNWKEWKKDGKEDKKLKKKVKKESTNQLTLNYHADQGQDESNSEIIYRENLVDNIRIFWLRKRSIFPFSYQKNNVNLCKENRIITLVNHTPGEMHLTQKSMLVRSLIKYYGDEDYFDFHPHTFIFSLRSKTRTKFSIPFECNSVYKKLISNKIKELNSIPRLWILKPSTGSCGRGISILELYPENYNELNIDELQTEIRKRILYITKNCKSEKSPEMILQSYIYNPLLYKGYKFDFRIYLMIACVKDPFICLYTQEGYLRICSDEYNNDYSNRNAHITNFHVQRDHPLYDPTTDSIEGRTTRVEYNGFIDYLNEINYINNFSNDEIENIKSSKNNQITNRDLIKSLLDKKVNYCLSKAVSGAKDNISSHSNSAYGQFALLGVDLLLDTFGNVWLIEFTKSPAFRMAPEFLQKMHTNVLQECVDIAMDVEKARIDTPNNEILDPKIVPAIQNSEMWKLLNI